MECRFTADEWQNLTPGEKAQRCRLMAAEMQALATAASSEMRHHYMKMAEDWRQLAIEIERQTIQPSLQ